MSDISEAVVTLLQFKKKLAALGHFYTSYAHIEHLNLQFRNQLDRLDASVGLR